MGLRYLGNINKPGYNPLASNITTGVNVAQYQGIFTTQQQLQAITTGQWVTDPLFDYSTLLLQADGTANGSQNNTFLDSSTNNFTITRNGNTTQGTFSPFSSQQGAWSNFFNGSSDYITYSTGITFGTSQFCIEFWFYYTGTFASQAAVYGGASSGVNSRLNLRINSTSVVIDQQGVASQSFTVPTIAPNTWNHVAICRNSSVATVFLNGTRSSTGTTANTVNYSTASDVIGYQDGVGYFPGYLSNFRVVLGSTPYDPTSSSIAVPAAPLTSITNTQLLTCQSNRFFDANTQATAKTFTATGTPSVQPFSPFAPQFQYTATGTGGSGYFDGTGDYLTAADNAAFDLGSGDFVVEAWAYSTNSTNFKMIIGQWNSGGNLSYTLRQNASKWAFTYTTNGTTEVALNGTSTQQLNAWAHLAVIRTGTTLSLFVNGTREATASVSGVTIFNNTGNFSVGGNGNGNDLWLGNIGPCRVIKGTLPSGYDATQSTLTVPTSPFTNTASTSILCNFTNAGIIDGTMKNDLETVGNVSVSTSVVKYGSGSMAFDGSGDRLYRSDVTPNFGFGTGDYTVEFWLYVTTFPASKYTLMDFRAVNGATPHTIYVSSTGFMGFYNGSSDVTSSSQPIRTGSWFHIAYARNAGTLRIFVNGIQAYSAANTIDYLTTRAITIGDGIGGQVGECLIGYMDEIRITKGIARYIQNFNPPTVALPRQ